jgi:hypothetical protein
MPAMYVVKVSLPRRNCSIMCGTRVTLLPSPVGAENRQQGRRVARNESKAGEGETFARTAGMTGIVILHEREGGT